MRNRTLGRLSGQGDELGFAAFLSIGEDGERAWNAIAADAPNRRGHEARLGSVPRGRRHRRLRVDMAEDF